MVNKKVEEALEYLSKIDLNSLPAGRYDVNEDFYYMIQEYETKAREDAKLESHDKFIDIQMILEGTEAIETDVRDNLKVKVEYNPDKDVTFYHDDKVMMRTILTPGSYMVLFPENVHKPSLRIDEPVKVRKCVGKVRA